MNKARNIDEYLSFLPEHAVDALAALGQTIQEAAPEAEEVFSYQLIGYKYLGPLLYMGAFKNHYSLMAAGKGYLAAFAQELKPYKVNGTTIQFKYDEPLPKELITQITLARVQQNQARHTAKQLKAKAPRS